jgi:hypothetical protein
LTPIISLVILLIFPRVSELTSGSPGIVASLRERLHVFDGLVAAWRRLTSMIVEPPNQQAPTSTPWSHPIERAPSQGGAIARVFDRRGARGYSPRTSVTHRAFPRTRIPDRLDLAAVAIEAAVAHQRVAPEEAGEIGARTKTPGVERRATRGVDHAGRLALGTCQGTIRSSIGARLAGSKIVLLVIAR